MSPWEVIKEMANELWLQRNIDSIYKWYSDDFVHHVGANMKRSSREEFRSGILRIFNAFSNTKLEIICQIEQSNTVTTHVHFYGDHKGQFLQYAASGNRVSMNGMRSGILRIFNAFSNTKLEIICQIEQSNTVTTHVHFYGDHKGQFLQYAASGNRVSMNGMRFDKVQGKVIVKNTTIFDFLSLIQQIQRGK